jgi:tetratricopeptide (TPR) repeat protein
LLLPYRYIYLIGALEKGTMVPVEKVKEVAAGFSYEVDLWLIQGALRQKKSEEYPAALKCYLSALECARLDATAKYAKVIPQIYTNIAALQLQLGSDSLALDSIRAALLYMKDTASGSRDANAMDTEDRAVDAVAPVFKDGEFEGIFYHWADSALTVQQSKQEGAAAAGGGGHFTVLGNSSGAALPFAVGDDVSIGDVIHNVTSITGDSFAFSCPLDVFELASSNGSSALPLHIKVCERNFGDASLTTCFNYARILEEVGLTSAATELYITLAKAHPSFTECYLRLSTISQSVGKKEDAKLWLDRAMIVNEASGDALVALGDMYQREGSLKEAKRILEDLVSHDKKDPRPMVAMGNLYHSMYQQSHDDKDLNLTYKYFHNVLQKDKANAYAATGLGVYVFCYTIVLPSFLVFRCFCHSLIHLLLPSCII